MNDKECNNVFRFSLFQENVILGQKEFDADKFNPFTRYSIDIRDILPKAITKLQKILSKKNYDVLVEVGRDKKNIENKEAFDVMYDLHEYNQNAINSYPEKYRIDMQYNPKTKIQHIENKIIKGVECKIGFYINNNPIVERIFYVDGFNPISRWSIDLTDTVIEIADLIHDKIKKIDVKNMWDDYDLINKGGLSINQIRELPSYKREELLKNLK